jgi:hypothetical protein
MDSFVAIDFSGDHRSCQEYINGLRNKSADHGVEIPTAVKDIPSDAITEVYRGNRGAALDHALEVVQNAIYRATDVYVNDSTNTFRRNRTRFKTQCCDRQGLVLDCLVLPPFEEGGTAGLLIDYDRCEDYRYSHRIITADGKFNARLMTRIHETNTLIDPLDIRYLNRDNRESLLFLHAI